MADLVCQLIASLDIQGSEPRWYGDWFSIRGRRLPRRRGAPIAKLSGEAPRLRMNKATFRLYAPLSTVPQ